MPTNLRFKAHAPEDGGNADDENGGTTPAHSLVAAAPRAACLVRRTFDVRPSSTKLNYVVQHVQADMATKRVCFFELARCVWLLGFARSRA